jgi:hypothetical protein
MSRDHSGLVFSQLLPEISHCGDVSLLSGLDVHTQMQYPVSVTVSGVPPGYYSVWMHGLGRTA